MIPIDAIESTAARLMEKAAIDIPDDYLNGLRAAAENEEADLPCFVLKTMLDNYDAAKQALDARLPGRVDVQAGWALLGDPTVVVER